MSVTSASSSTTSQSATTQPPTDTSITRLTIGMTGSTGSIYGIRLLEVLQNLRIETHLVMSDWAAKCISMETSYTTSDVKSLATFTSDDSNMAAAISSGTYLTNGMIVAPCSMKTVSAIANGYDDTLIARAAGVTIKESRKLILMARETPLSAIHLENLLKLARLGVVILPPMTEFYTKPKTLDDVINHTIGKCLDQFQIIHSLSNRWGSS